MNILLTLTWLIGLVLSAALLIGLLWRTDWNHRNNPGGRAMVSFSSVTTATYLLSVVVLIVPDFFERAVGQWFRIGSRLVVALVLWNLLFLFLRAQREAGSPKMSERRDERPYPCAEDDPR